MSDALTPVKKVIDSQIQFVDPRVGSAFYSAMELLFNDLEIGLYRPSDKCNAGMEHLDALLEDISGESLHEIMDTDEKVLISEAEVVEEDEPVINLNDSDDEEEEEEIINLGEDE